MFWIGETDYPLADRLMQYMVESDPVCPFDAERKTKSSFSAQITR